MAHYVMSDIHGEAARFHAMLEKIQFSADDTLYILGGAFFEFRWNSEKGHRFFAELSKIIKCKPTETHRTECQVRLDKKQVIHVLIFRVA